MLTKALFVKLEAKPGKEQALADFLHTGYQIVLEEPKTITWYALQFGPGTFGIFDSFEAEDGRQAHLSGKVAEALMKHAPDLLATTPNIEQVSILATKQPK